MAFSGSVTIVRGPTPVGNYWEAVGRVVLDSSYESGGENVALKEFGFGPEAVFQFATCDVKNLSEQATYQPNAAEYTGTKLKVFDNATGKELAASKDLSKVTVLVTVVCTSR